MFILRFFLFLVVCITAASIFFIVEYSKPLNTPAKTLWIKPGTGLYAIEHQLRREGILKRKDQFYIPALSTYEHGFMNFRSGEYEITPEMSPIDLVQKLATGDTKPRKFKILEGLRAKDVLKVINENPYFEGDKLLSLEEGGIFPDTYFYERGEKRAAFLKRIQDNMRETLNGLWQKYGAQSFLKSPEEALILASIIEKEAQLKEERPIIAAVFLNRLRKKMRLESCASVLYALHLQGVSKNFLTYKDLKIESPYNTYIHGGLTPKPIAMPGREALHAALNPELVGYLYFVVNGEGGHFFANHYRDHLKNVRKSRRFFKDKTVAYAIKK